MYVLPTTPAAAPLTDIKAGQGLYYSATTLVWRARNCDVDNYGVSNTTYGLTPQPCKVYSREQQCRITTLQHYNTHVPCFDTRAHLKSWSWDSVPGGRTPPGVWYTPLGGACGPCK